MAAKTAYSIQWNERANQYVARYRKWNSAGWGTKRIPKRIRRHQEMDAQRFMISWYAEHERTGGVAVENARIVPAARTLHLVSEKWLAYRYEDPGTAINTYRNSKRVVENWILSNTRFDHVSIDTLDMQESLARHPQTIVRWIDSVAVTSITKLRYAEVLKSIFVDAIALGWLDRATPNPFDDRRLARVMTHLRDQADRERTTTYLSALQVTALLTEPSRKVWDYRRVRYLVALSTGARDMEIQGLVFDDLHLGDEVAWAWIDRQLAKPGRRPARHVRDLRSEGLSKDEVMALPNAVVKEPKRGSRRALPLLPVVAAALTWWRATGWQLYTGHLPQGGDPIFPVGHRNKLSRRGEFCFSESARLLRADLDRLGHRGVFVDPQTGEEHDLTFHSLRHTFSTRLEAAGVDRARIGELLGHKSRDVAAKHYIGKLVESRARVVESLGLPTTLALTATTIEVAGNEVDTATRGTANVVRMKATGWRRP